MAKGFGLSDEGHEKRGRKRRASNRRNGSEPEEPRPESQNGLHLISKNKKFKNCSNEAKRQSASGRANSQTNILKVARTGNIWSRYGMVRVLGQGSFGITYLCIERATGLRYACKAIKKRSLVTKEQIEDMVREVEILQHLPKHPNIVGLEEAYEDDFHIYVVMELCEGGELFDRIKRKRFYKEREAAVAIKSIVEVIKFCNDHGVMHCDLKPENLMYSNKEETSPLKAIDFGFSTYFWPGERFSEIRGTTCYMAPEVLSRDYSHEVDIWSAGVILYILLCGLPPFYGETEEEVIKSVRSSTISFEGHPWDMVSDEAKGLVSGMLNRDPEMRLTAQQVLGQSRYGFALV